MTNSANSAQSPAGALPAHEKGGPESSDQGVTAANTGRCSLAPMAAGSQEGEQC